MPTSPDTTQLVVDASVGDEKAVGELLDHGYEELRRIAHRELRRRRLGPTLNTTAQVHEAYLELFDRGAPGRIPLFRGHDPRRDRAGPRDRRKDRPKRLAEESLSTNLGLRRRLIGDDHPDTIRSAEELRKVTDPTGGP